MRAVLQRVENASVHVDGQTVGAIGRGVLVLVAVEQGDDGADARLMADRLAGLRLFSDNAGKMNLDAGKAGGSFLVVSQFTLAASLRKGRRPSFNGAAEPGRATELVDLLVEELGNLGFEVATGQFGADMRVRLVNDGPVTFILEIRDGRVL
ncbi:MAG: D-aminoacyl-tRNA deacylase [Acidobacteriota bacterium]